MWAGCRPVVAGVLGVLAVWTGRARGQSENVLTPAEKAAGFVLLFDGKSLDGWTTSGDMSAWAVKNGEIVIQNDQGAWLRTARQYRDFELTLDFNMSKDANSGVGLR